MSDSATPTAPRAGSGKHRIFVSTGSTSSDVLFSPILAEIIRRGEVGEAVGVGGRRLADLGVNLLFDTTPTSSVGIVNGLLTTVRHAAGVFGAVRRAEDYFRKSKPDLCLFVDNPGQNLRALALARGCGRTTMYCIPPEVWSLFRWELRGLIEKADVVATILKSEGEHYRRRGARGRWVGHPLVDLLAAIPRPAPNPSDAPLIGLFPGSRRSEVLELLPVLCGAAELLLRDLPKARFVMSVANDVVGPLIRAFAPLKDLPVELAQRNSQQIIAGCDLLLTCSGTVTLEAAVLGVPQVTMYRLSLWIDRVIQQVLLQYSHFKHFALPNFLLDKDVVPEIWSERVTAENVAESARQVMTETACRRIMDEGYAEVRELLGPPGAISRAADLIQETLNHPPKRRIFW